MADLKKILGVMMATGLAGRTSKGTAFAAAAPMLLGSGKTGGGWSFAQKAGLAGLAYLAYRAYSDSGNTTPIPEPEKPSGGPFAPLFRMLHLPGFTDKQPEAQAINISDDRAMLLIRSMVAAANADGEITTAERQAVLNRLAEAGAGADDRQVVERLFENPPTMDEIVREVGSDDDTAEQVYLTSRLALRGGTNAERSYLDYLASRLRIEGDRREKLDQTA